MRVIIRFGFLFYVVLGLQFSSGLAMAVESGSQQEKERMKTEKHTNKLIHESSPYLLQHAHNPVDWYPWGEEALEKARAENKLLLISIGYAACHWCHVMERESFENEQVAQIMNRFFVCVKVDREERPDVDQVYMDAVQLMTGRGGWPLNCFALPDGRPFYGGTYFRTGDWVQVLKGVQNAFQNENEKVLKAAEQISQGVRSMDLIKMHEVNTDFDLAILQRAYEKWKQNFDLLEGGSKHVPKFPLPNSYQFLMRYYHYTGDKSSLDHLLLSLDKMAKGGIYDQLGGGFSRYSTDKEWLVPHFEKMLYDNGQLISLYAQAYQLTKKPLYLKTVVESIAFVKREMYLDEGGFFSSLDADSEGVEGKFYVWSSNEIDDLLGNDAVLFKEYFGVREEGNWEHSNILHKVADEKILMQKYNLTDAEFGEKIELAKKKLFAYRSTRVRPGLDDKVLTSWNALMLKGLVDAYKAIGDQEYFALAEKNADFIVGKMMRGGVHLHRNYKNGQSGINGFLDDYSFTIEAFIAMYQVSFDSKWLYHARDLIEYVIAHFYDKQSGMFFYTSDEDPALIARKMELVDNVIPSSNSSIAKGLYLLGKYLDKEEYVDKAAQMVANVQDRLQKSLAYHSNWAMLMMHLAEPPYELAVVGREAEKFRKVLDCNYLPDVLVFGSKGKSELSLLENRYVQNKTMLYLCKDKVCKLPVSQVEELLDQLRNARKLGKVVNN